MLTAGSDYYLSVDNGASTETSWPYSNIPEGPPYRFMLSIVSPTSAIYTTSYVPLLVNFNDGTALYLDSNRMARLLATGAVGIDNLVGDRADIYLNIIVRSRDTWRAFHTSPIIREYSLMAK